MLSSNYLPASSPKVKTGRGCALKGLTAFEYVNLCRYYEAEAYLIDFEAENYIEAGTLSNVEICSSIDSENEEET